MDDHKFLKIKMISINNIKDKSSTIEMSDMSET